MTSTSFIFAICASAKASRVLPLFATYVCAPLSKATRMSTVAGVAGGAGSRSSSSVSAGAATPSAVWFAGRYDSFSAIVIESYAASKLSDSITAASETSRTSVPSSMCEA